MIKDVFLMSVQMSVFILGKLTKSVPTEDFGLRTRPRKHKATPKTLSAANLLNLEISVSVPLVMR